MIFELGNILSLTYIQKIHKNSFNVCKETELSGVSIQFSVPSGCIVVIHEFGNILGLSQKLAVLLQCYMK